MTPIKTIPPSTMEKVCLCLDLEGFHLQGQFICREMGFCNWTRQQSGVRHYYLPVPFHHLSSKEKRTALWVMRNIHGLTYQPPAAAHGGPSILLESHVRALVACHRTEQRDTVAYKGGHVEKDLLARLGIPALDLEAYGCPPFRKMKRLAGVEGCGFYADPLRHHCPQVECQHFVDWMRQQSGLSHQSTYLYHWSAEAQSWTSTTQ